MTGDISPKPTQTDAEPVPEPVDGTPAASSFWGAYQQLMYGLSLPERTLRSTTALVGGTLHEAGRLLIPQAFRSSRSYGVLIQQSLDFLIGEVGGVKVQNQNAAAPDVAQNSVARKAVGSFLDLAGVATLHLSPLTVLAIASDVAYGSQTYLRELAVELKRAGVIDEKSTIHHAADLLDAVQRASNVSSSVFDAPPLSVDGMKKTIDQTIQSMKAIDPSKVIPQAELDRMWVGIMDVARKEGVSPFELSSSLALYTIDKLGLVGRGTLSSVTIAGNLFDRHILEHYRAGLRETQQRGLYPMLSETYRPYVDAVWSNYSSSRSTITEKVLSGKLFGDAWTAVSGWWSPSSSDSTENATGEKPEEP